MTRWLSPRSRLVPVLAALALGAGILPAYATAAEPQPQSEVDAVSQVEEEAAVAPASGPVPFTCEPNLYQSATQSGSSRLYVYDPVTNTYSTVGGNTGANPNGMGYNTADNFIYGVETQGGGSTQRKFLFQLDSTGTYRTRGALAAAGELIGYGGGGDFWGPNRLLVSGPGDDTDPSNHNWKSIDISDPDNPDLSDPDNPVVTDFTLTGAPFRAADFTILGNMAYGLNNTTPNNTLQVVNLITQVVSHKTTSDDSGTSGFGAAYSDALGNLYFHSNGGSVYRILAEDIDDPNPRLTSMGAATTQLGTPNDGASCPNAGSAFSATISNQASSAVTASSAQLAADVNPNTPTGADDTAAATTAVVCFGTTSATSGGALQGCTRTSQFENASDDTPLRGSSVTGLMPLTVTGLTDRTTYYWQVVAENSFTTTYGSVASFTTTAAPISTTQSASSVSTTTATLNGLVNPGNRSTNVDFCYGTDADLTVCTNISASQSPVSGTSDASVSASVSGLTPGVRYYARVSATNADGSASGSIVSFTTLDVPSVALGTTSDVTSTDARLNASVDPKGLSTDVEFCYGTDSNLASCDDTVIASESPLVAVNTSVDVTADLTGLSPSTTYYVRVTANNSNGTASSSIGSFTTSARPLVLTTTTGSLTTGTVGTVYSRTLSADGGTAPYTWGVVGGSLPSGLSLNSTTGAITGTPLFDGGSSFTIEVTDATSQTATKVFSISVVDSPDAITTAATSVGTTSVVINGSVDPGNLVTAATFCYGTASNLTGCIELAADQSPLAAGPSNVSVSVTLTGLTPGTTYYARVQAVNSTGSDAGNIVSFTTTSAPDASTVSAIFRDKAGQAILTGSIDPGGLSTNVSFCWGTTPTLVGCDPVDADQSPISASHETGTVSQIVTGLTQGATYYFNVTATNSAGTDVGSTVEFTMPLIDAPSPTIDDSWTATGDAAGGTTVTITGTNFSSVGSGPTVSVGGVAATVTAFTATSLTVTTPAGDPGEVDVIVFNLDGQAVRATNAFTYTSATTYSITYNANGATSGSAPTDATAYDYNDPATVEGAGTLVRTGYQFAGWNTSAVGVGTAYSVGATPAITADLTLYAQWRAIADLGTSASSLSFGTRAVGSGSQTTRTVAVTNSGAAIVSVSSPGITITGTDAGDFSVSGGTCTDGGSITAFASCTIDVAFDPQAAGSRSATLSIATSDGTQTVTLAGSGTGSSPTPTPTPAPVVAAGPPVDVTAVAGDGRVSVSWKPPVSSGSFPVSDYVMRAAPGGASCVVAVPVTSCVIEGLTNGVAYTVTGRALTGAGWGAASAPSAPVVPSSSAQPVPQPDPVPGPVPAGSVQVTIDGQLDPQATATPDANSAVVVVSGDYTVDAAALDPAGRALPLGEGNQVQPMAGQRVAVSGARFHPSTYAAVYVHDPEPGVRKALGEPVIIGAVLVDDSGMFTGAWVLPDEVVAGEYVLQVVGTTMRLEALSANLGMSVLQSLDRSIRITGERMVSRALARRVFVTGVTENLDGERVQARVKVKGETTYRQGSMRTVRDGEFTWQRRTNKKVYVYFETVSSSMERVRSNRIILVQVGR